MNINFENIQIHDMYGNTISTIDGDFTPDTLTDYLVNKWVPYVECHRKCYAADACEYAQTPRRDARCGLQKAIIKNFIYMAKNNLCEGTSEEKEALLGGAFHIAGYAAQATNDISMLANEHVISEWKEYAHIVVTITINLREKLNLAGQFLSKVPNIYRRKPIILVEGESEKAFLCKLKESHLAWFTNLRIEVYGGSGNTNPKRIEMRLDKYNEDGYVCYMQGDKDGKEKSNFDKLIRKGTVKPENIFEFKHDFETSIPPKVLLKVLQNLGVLNGVELDEFSAYFDSNRSASEILLDKYSLDIKPLKIEIADETAWLINNSDFRWYQDPNKFLEKEELGRFLDFIIKMNG